MSKGWKIFQGRPYVDPRGFYLTPRRVFLSTGEGDQLIYHPDTGKPVARFHDWMAWQWLVWACVYEGGGRTIVRDGMVVHLARGQCLYSLDYLKVAWGFKAKSSVSRLLGRLEAVGRVRLDWPTFKTVEHKRVAKRLEHKRGYSRATPPAGSTDLVNPKQALLPKAGYRVQPQTGRRTQRKTQRLGRLVTVLNYDTYQSLDFYAATPLATSGATPDFRVAGRSRDDRGTNKKSLKSYKKYPRARSTSPPSYPQSVDKDPTPTPITWDAIRGAVNMGIWANLPAHVQEAQLQEALEADPHVPEDLKAVGIINGHPNPEADRLTQLRQVRDMLKGGD